MSSLCFGGLLRQVPPVLWAECYLAASCSTAMVDCRSPVCLILKFAWTSSILAAASLVLLAWSCQCCKSTNCGSCSSGILQHEQAGSHASADEDQQDKLGLLNTSLQIDLARLKDCVCHC